MTTLAAPDVDLMSLALTTDNLRLADALWLVAFGEHPAQVAARLGVTPGAVAQLLSRHGLSLFARPFWNEQGRLDRRRRAAVRRAAAEARRRAEAARRLEARRLAPLLAMPHGAHGTWERWRIHVALGEDPCASCALAAADYWTTRRAA